MHNPAHSKLKKEMNEVVRKYNNELELLVNTKQKYTQYSKDELNQSHVVFYEALMIKCRGKIKDIRNKIVSYKERIRIAQRDHNLKVYVDKG